MTYVTPKAQFQSPEQARELADKVRALNDAYRHHSATEVMHRALTDLGQIALVSSFGAESVVLLHMAAMIRRDTPVLFIDTAMLFPETLVYQQELSERLGLTGVRIVRASDTAEKDPDGTLHQRDTDACCFLRKTAPMQAALDDFDGWITGRKRFQSQTRAALDFFEVEDGHYMDEASSHIMQRIAQATVDHPWLVLTTRSTVPLSREVSCALPEQSASSSNTMSASSVV